MVKKHVSSAIVIYEELKKNLFNNSINEGKAHLNSFTGATINRLNHFITSIFEENRSEIVIIHIGSNDYNA